MTQQPRILVFPKIMQMKPQIALSILLIIPTSFLMSFFPIFSLFCDRMIDFMGKNETIKVFIWFGRWCL
jgi:hypothetical protein